MTNNDKVSVIVPTYNEEKNIKKLILSIINQEYKADEIIISDGRSTDKTIKIINQLQKKYNNIKLSGRKGFCRGSGRNTAIEYSKNNIIALIDSGTVANNNWLKNLFDTLNKKKVSIVFGSIKSDYNDLISRNIANIIYGRNNKDETLSYSVASMIMKKNVWEILGKFPESKKGNYVVEDLRFIESIKKSDYKFEIEKKAVVFWDLPNSIGKIFKRYKEYSIGAVASNYAKTWHTKVFKNYAILFLLILIITYSFGFIENVILLLLTLIRSHFYIRNKKKYKHRYFRILFDHLCTSFILLIIDFCAIIGFVEYKTKKYFLK